MQDLGCHRRWYCRADDIRSLVIKRPKDAEADNDTILGVILGAGIKYSVEAVFTTYSHAGRQAYLSRQAGVDALDVSHIELHGTGTKAGDHEEMQGIMAMYAPLTKRRSKDQTLYIRAAKSNVGHNASAAGTTALIEAVLMIHQNGDQPQVPSRL